MGYSYHQAVSEAEAQLGEQLAIAVGQARQHGNAGAAKLLIEAGDAAHQHIDKSDKFDDAVSDCLDGGGAPENYSFGQFEANVAVIVDMCAELQKLKDGEVRPEPPKVEAPPGVEELRSEKLSDKGPFNLMKRIDRCLSDSPFCPADTSVRSLLDEWGASTRRLLTVLTVP